MKKLLVILTLALALCLLCGAALADGTILYLDGKYEVKNYTEMELLVGQKIKVDGKEVEITSVPARSAVMKAGHNEEAYVNAYGKVGTQDCIVEIHMKSTHRALAVDWAKTVDATCSENGVAAFYCRDCDYTTSSVVEKTGLHTKETINVAATCQHGNQVNVVCTLCGKVFSSTDDGAKVAHDFDSAEGEAAVHWKTSTAYWQIVAPSCSATSTHVTGKAYRLCRYCKTEKKEWTAADGWTPVWNTSDDATNVANYKKWMQNHGVIVDASFDGHTWDKAVEHVAADCAHAAGIKKWCKVCSTYVFQPDAGSKPLAPVWRLETPSDLTCALKPVWVICDTCNGSVPGHIFKGTATKKAGSETKAKDLDGNEYETGFVATITDGADVSFDVNVTHKFTKLVAGSEVTVKPDGDDVVCTQYVKAKYECAEGCGCTDQPMKIKTPATDHDWSAWKMIDDGKGNTETKRYERVCSVCKTRQVRAFEEAPIVHKTAAEHIWVDDPTYKFVCETKNDVPQTCVCGATRIDYNREVGHVALKETVYKPATCKETGFQHRVCTNCKLDEYVEIPVGAHTPAEPIVTPATTEKEGSEVVKCAVCGETISTKVLPKLLGETEFSSDYKFDPDTMTLAGKATQKEGTKEAEKVFARVTYFLADGTFIAVSVPVEEDGTFESMCTSPLAHVSVRIVDSAKVRPGEYNYLDK